jgi:glycosyltransferase involved in cell wall biosynthesis
MPLFKTLRRADPVGEEVDSVHIIGSRQFGGADRFYVRLVKALSAASHRVLAVTRPTSPIGRGLGPDIDLVQIPMRNGWDLLSFLSIRRLLRRTQPPIVQTYMGRATRLTHVPAKTHAVHVARLGGYYKIRGYYEHANAWVGNTKGVCDYLVRCGLPADRVYLIGNFVDVPSPMSQEERFGLKRSCQIPEQAVVVFSLARFISIKGMDDLLSAFARLPREDHSRPIHLLLAGDGPLLPQLEALTGTLGIADRVHWVGWQDEPGPFYEISDLFVCPSRRETLGNVILEAWAHRIPVLATRTPGAEELITHEENGILVPCSDPESLAEGMRVLLKAGMPVLESMAERGIQTLRTKFSREGIVKAYLSLYSRLGRLFA